MENWKSPSVCRSIEDKTLFTPVSFSNSGRPGRLPNILYLYILNLSKCCGHSKKNLCTPTDFKCKLKI